MDSSSRVSCLFPNDVIPPAFGTSPRARVKKPLIVNDNRRHAAYFPSKASLLGAKTRRINLPAPSVAPSHGPLFDDDESTWEFSAPLQAPSLCSSRSSSCESSGSGSSAAQMIALEYRLRHLDDSWTRDDFSDYEYVPVCPPSPKSPEEDHSSHSKGPGPHDEALNIMKMYHLGPDGRVVCQRPGCRETLEGYKDLMYHLHLHDANERSVTCPHCKGHFDGQREVGMHNCRRRPRSTPSGPIRDGFFRVLNKIASHK